MNDAILHTLANGDLGGYIVAEGTPEEIMQCQDSYTGKALNDLKDSFIYG